MGVSGEQAAFVAHCEMARATFPLNAEELREVAACRHGHDVQRALSQACVGIVGLGGLGSNVAVFLARAGVGRLVLVDFDAVDATNLNRQHYFGRHLGHPKAWALADQLLDVNPYLSYEPHVTRVDASNVQRLFGTCDVVVEAVDEPDQKAAVTEAVLMGLPDALLVGASGMAGLGSPNDICTRRRFDRWYLCGDGASDVEEEGFLAAPRVALCAGHQALTVMRLLAGREQRESEDEPRGALQGETHQGPHTELNRDPHKEPHNEPHQEPQGREAQDESIEWRTRA